MVGVGVQCPTIRVGAPEIQRFKESCLPAMAVEAVALDADLAPAPEDGPSPELWAGWGAFRLNVRLSTLYGA